MIIKYDEKELRRIKRGACLAIGGIGLFLGAFGIAYACTKYHNIEKMVSDATSHISKLTSVDVEDSIIEKAVADSASRQIDKAVSKAVSAIKMIFPFNLVVLSKKLLPNDMQKLNR